MKNPIFWAARCIQEIFIPEIQVFHREILTKVLACLQNDIVEKEATSIEQETWKRLNELVAEDVHRDYSRHNPTRDMLLQNQVLSRQPFQKMVGHSYSLP